jgi:hypothetical protein
MIIDRMKDKLDNTRRKILTVRSPIDSWQANEFFKACGMVGEPIGDDVLFRWFM